MLKKIFIFIFCASAFTIQASETFIPCKKEKQVHILQTNLYHRTEYMSDEAWEQVQPYLLPYDHPAKEALDKIFSSSRVTESLQHLKKAGFTFSPPRKELSLICAAHPKLGKYLIKTYLDTHYMEGNEWVFWIRRIEGSRRIQKSIDEHGLQKLVKVPKKWIYPLEEDPSPSNQNLHRKNFILVTENMQIMRADKNAERYKKVITEEQLNALHTLLTENWLTDSIYIDNIPFSIDGRIAFIDTEHFMQTDKQLKLHRLGRRLSEKMKLYWNELIQQSSEFYE